jgi:hypothetical protein
LAHLSNVRLLEQNVSLFRRYEGILTYMFLNVVLHVDSENGIKIEFFPTNGNTGSK